MTAADAKKRKRARRRARAKIAASVRWAAARPALAHVVAGADHYARRFIAKRLPAGMFTSGADAIRHALDVMETSNDGGEVLFGPGLHHITGPLGR